MTYQQNRSSDGRLFIKLPNISFPFSGAGSGGAADQLIQKMGNQVHTDAGVSSIQR